MMFDDRPDDEGPDFEQPEYEHPGDVHHFREPPPPDDRLWRHPSEVAVASGVAATSPRAGHSAWAIALCAGSVGALVATGVIAATGGLRRDITVIRPTADRVLAQPLSTRPSTDLEVVQAAARVRPSIAQVRVTRATGPDSGSAVMFRTDGHLLTNWRTVEAAQTIKVVLATGKELLARVVGADRDTDVAILKVAGGPYPVAELGAEVALRPGQRAIALGSPLGPADGPSVTVGVVSALHRRVDTREGVALLDMIQTDAPVSPGSAGGPLIDNAGAVIGITSAVVARDGGDGLGFATPIETARMVGEQLITNGRFVHVWLGLEGSDVDGDVAAQLGIDGGALVDNVTPGGPAERAGLAAADVIVGIDDRPIMTMGALVVSLRGRPPGEVVVLDVIRESKRRAVRVTLAERPAT
jgi:S1-C subfamily serine protease